MLPIDYSVPTASAERAGNIRSITRRSPGSARRWCARCREGRPLRFIVGRDTRESGEWIERELARGVRSEGARDHQRRSDPDAPRRLRDARDGLRRRPRHLGVAQSVSRTTASRCSPGAARSSPRRSSGKSKRSSPTRAGGRRAAADVPVERTDVIDAYIAHARLALPDPQRLGRLKIAIDTANGATTTVAPRLFRSSGSTSRC